MGLNVKWTKVADSLAPQYPLKILLPDLLVREEDFGDVGHASWLAQLLSFINISVSSFAWELRRITRHSSRFTHDALLPLRCSRCVFNMSPLRGYPNPMVADGIRS